MVGSNGTMIAIRLVRSKLRKREDHHHHHNGSTVHPEQVQTITQSNGGIVNPAMSHSTEAVDSCCQQQQSNSVDINVVNNNVNINNSINDNINNNSGSCQQSIVTALNGNLQQQQQQQESHSMVYTTTNAEQFIWQFPPPAYPSPNTPPPQYTLYNDQDTLVHGLQQGTDGRSQDSFAKGFRKNIGGRWRRLVKKKPESESCAIPPELKDQLKTIYVY